MFIAILQGWWFIALPLGIFSTWAFPYYFEFLIAALAYDSLYGSLGIQGWTAYLGTIISALCMCSVIILKKVLR